MKPGIKIKNKKIVITLPKGYEFIHSDLSKFNENQIELKYEKTLPNVQKMVYNK